jgi:type I restriction enzyme R subunit
VILTTSQLLTTGVDAPMVKNVVLARVIGSMTEFKQIIGRGTRVREDYGKLFFNILDYTGSATQMFADPEFDGEPALVDETLIDAAGEVIEETVVEEPSEDEDGTEVVIFGVSEEDSTEPRKFYYDGGIVEVAAEMVYELDAEGKQLRVISYTDHAKNNVRSMYRSSAELEAGWANNDQRRTILQALNERGIDLTQLSEVASAPEADPLDLLCHLAFNGPLRTRRERAERLARGHQDFFDRYGGEARAILQELLDQYTERNRTTKTARCPQDPSNLISWEPQRDSPLFRRRRSDAKRRQ